MASIELLIDLWAIGGIGLEIWGFIWLLEYGKGKNFEEFTNWYKKNNDKLENEFKHQMKGARHRMKSMVAAKQNVFQSDLITEIWDETELPIIKQRFVRLLDSRRSWAIRLVIIGLGGQIAQILHEDILQIIQSM